MKTRRRPLILASIALVTLGGVATQVQYKSKPRTPLWVNEQYGYFKDKIVEVEGRFHDATPAVFIADYWGREIKWGFYSVRLSANGKPERIPIHGNLTKGQMAILAGEVFQVLNGNSILLRANSERSVLERGPILVHLTGLASTDGLIDGQPLAPDEKNPSSPKPLAVVILGTFRYDRAMGGTSTVPSVKLIGRLNKEEFVEALNQGLELEKWTAQTTVCPECRGSKGKENCRTCKGSGMLTKVVRTPIE